LLDQEDKGESSAYAARRFDVAKSATRAGESMKMERKSRVFGATLTAEERERMSQVEE
jgi:hypothetical protein